MFGSGFGVKISIRESQSIFGGSYKRLSLSVTNCLSSSKKTVYFVEKMWMQAFTYLKIVVLQKPCGFLVLSLFGLIRLLQIPLWSSWRNKVLIFGDKVEISSVRERIAVKFDEMVDVHQKPEHSPSDVDALNLGRLRLSKAVFVDASWKDGLMGTAAVLVNLEQGSWFFKFLREPCSSALEAESRVVLEALKWAVQKEWLDVTMISDSQIIVQALFNSLADGLAKRVRLSNHPAGVFVGEGLPPVFPISLSV
uniref:RNase H type-1 domain-containing protein n=1 Tax=Cannabis sativa TaxID=3483 RepID=A0A803NIL0_CANSA